MDSATPLVESVVQPRHQEALAVVLGACILVIGLCSFAAVILLIQQFQRSSNSNAVNTRVPSRRATKATAMTTQYRPLSDTTRRHRGDLASSLARPPSGSAVGRSGSSSPRSIQSIGTNNPSPFVFTPAAPPASSATAAAPSAAAAAPTPVVPAAATTTANAAAPPSISNSGATGVAATKSIDSIDITLLSRIDQALASGIMRPQEATQLLKSCGCDLEELLREELGEREAVVIGRGALPMASSGTSSAAVALGNTPCPQPPHAPPPPERAPKPAAPRRPEAPASPAAAFGRISQADRDPAAGAPATTAATTAAGTVIDDALLLKIDRALASGCMRPDQATQLLKSYGCDVEELLREELGGGSGSAVRSMPSDALSL